METLPKVFQQLRPSQAPNQLGKLVELTHLSVSHWSERAGWRNYAAGFEGAIARRVDDSEVAGAANGDDNCSVKYNIQKGEARRVFQGLQEVAGNVNNMDVEPLNNTLAGLDHVLSDARERSLL